MKYKHNSKPSIKLSNAQKRVALERAMKKGQQAPMGGMGMPPMGPPMGGAPPMGMPPMGMPPGGGMGAPPMGPMGGGGPMPPMASMPPMPGMPGAETSPPPMPAGPTGMPDDAYGMEEQMDYVSNESEDDGSKELTDVQELAQFALIADQLWKDGGGNHSIGAKVWEDLLDEAQIEHLESPRDYFISSYVSWKDDPEKFRKKHPKETRLLRQLDNEFDASHQEVTDV